MNETKKNDAKTDEPKSYLLPNESKSWKTEPSKPSADSKNPFSSVVNDSHSFSIYREYDVADLDSKTTTENTTTTQHRSTKNPLPSPKPLRLSSPDGENNNVTTDTNDDDNNWNFRKTFFFDEMNKDQSNDDIFGLSFLKSMSDALPSLTSTTLDTEEISDSKNEALSGKDNEEHLNIFDNNEDDQTKSKDVAKTPQTIEKKEGGTYKPEQETSHTIEPTMQKKKIESDPFVKDSSKRLEKAKSMLKAHVRNKNRVVWDPKHKTEGEIQDACVGVTVTPQMKDKVAKLNSSESKLTRKKNCGFETPKESRKKLCTAIEASLDQYFSSQTIPKKLYDKSDQKATRKEKDEHFFENTHKESCNEKLYEEWKKEYVVLSSEISELHSLKMKDQELIQKLQNDVKLLNKSLDKEKAQSTLLRRGKKDLERRQHEVEDIFVKDGDTAFLEKLKNFGRKNNFNVLVVEQTENLLKKQQENVQNLREQLNTIVNENEKLNHILSKKDDALSRYEKEISTLKADLVETRDSLKNVITESGILSDQMEELETSAADNKLEIELILNQKVKLEDDVAAANNVIRTLKNEKNELQKDNERVMKMLDDEQQTNASIQSEMAIAAETINTMRNQIATYEGVEKDLALKKDEYKNVTNELISCRSKNVELENAKNKLNEKLESISFELCEHKLKLEKCDNEKIQVESDLKNCKKELNQIKEEFVAEKSNYDLLKDENTLLNDCLKSRNDTILKSKADLHNLLNESVFKNSTPNTDRNENLDDEIGALMDLLSSQKMKLSELEEKEKSLTRNYNKLLQEKQDLVSSSLNLENEINGKTKELKQSKNNLRAMEIERDEFQGEIEILNDNKTTLEKELNDANIKIEEQEKLFSNLRDKIDLLEFELEDMRNEMQGKDEQISNLKERNSRQENRQFDLTKENELPSTNKNTQSKRNEENKKAVGNHFIGNEKELSFQKLVNISEESSKEIQKKLTKSNYTEDEEKCSRMSLNLLQESFNSSRKEVHDLKLKLEAKILQSNELEEKVQTFFSRLYENRSMIEKTKVDFFDVINEINSLKIENKKMIEERETLEHKMQNDRKIITMQKDNLNQLNYVVESLKEQSSHDAKKIKQMEHMIEEERNKRQLHESKVLRLESEFCRLESSKDEDSQNGVAPYALDESKEVRSVDFKVNDIVPPVQKDLLQKLNDDLKMDNEWLYDQVLECNQRTEDFLEDCILEMKKSDKSSLEMMHKLQSFLESNREMNDQSKKFKMKDQSTMHLSNPCIQVENVMNRHGVCTKPSRTMKRGYVKEITSLKDELCNASEEIDCVHNSVSTLQASLEECKSDRKRLLTELSVARETLIANEKEKTEMTKLVQEIYKRFHNSEETCLNSLNFEPVCSNNNDISVVEGFSNFNAFENLKIANDKRVEKNDDGGGDMNESVDSDTSEDMNTAKNERRHTKNEYHGSSQKNIFCEKSIEKIFNTSKDQLLFINIGLIFENKRVAEKVIELEKKVYDLSVKLENSIDQTNRERDELKRADETADAEAKRADEAEDKLAEVLDLLEESNNELAEAVQIKCLLESQLVEAIHGINEFEKGVKENVIPYEAVKLECSSMERSITRELIQFTRCLTDYMRKDAVPNARGDRDHVTKAWRSLGRMSRFLSDHDQSDFVTQLPQFPVKDIKCEMSVASSLTTCTKAKIKMSPMKPKAIILKGEHVPISEIDVKTDGRKKENQSKLNAFGHINGEHISHNDLKVVTDPDESYNSTLNNLISDGECILNNSLKDILGCSIVGEEKGLNVVSDETVHHSAKLNFVSNGFDDSRNLHSVQYLIEKCETIESERDRILMDALNLVQSSKEVRAAESQAAEAKLRKAVTLQVRLKEEEHRAQLGKVLTFMNMKYNKLRCFYRWKLFVSVKE